MNLPQEQLRIALAMLACGAALGAAYDALYLLRRAFLPGRAALHALDLFYGVLFAAGVAGAALALRADVLRWYVLLAAALGAGAYRMSAGAALRLLLDAAGRFWRKSRKAGTEIPK